jgi:hypothetical protein
MKRFYIILAVILIMVLCSANAFAASAKATAQCVNLREVPYSSPEYWYPVFKSSIHTANDKELITDVSFEIGIITDTTVWSKRLQRAVANAMAKVEILVVMNPGYTADPEGREIWDESGEVALPGEVTFAMRDQTLVARLAGQLPLVYNPEDGLWYVKNGFDLTEIEEEMIRLTLDTLTAHSFNFVLPNCLSGTHAVTVFARLTYTDFDETIPLTDDDLDPAVTYGFSHAYLGKGSVTIEEVRMVKTDFELE